MTALGVVAAVALAVVVVGEITLFALGDRRHALLSVPAISLLGLVQLTTFTDGLPLPTAPGAVIAGVVLSVVAELVACRHTFRRYAPCATV